MRRTSIILSIAALVLSLLSLYIACINPEKDWSSNLIATLGVLCTVLIGWQIFSWINLFQYEKRMKDLESGIEESKVKLNEAMVSAYTSLNNSDGLQYHALADVYHQLANPSYCSPENFLFKSISWLLAEIDVYLYAQNVKELIRAKSDIQNSIDSEIKLPELFKTELKQQWKVRTEHFRNSAFPKPKVIMDEVEEITRLLDSL